MDGSARRNNEFDPGSMLNVLINALLLNQVLQHPECWVSGIRSALNFRI